MTCYLSSALFLHLLELPVSPVTSRQNYYTQPIDLGSPNRHHKNMPPSPSWPTTVTLIITATLAILGSTQQAGSQHLASPCPQAVKVNTNYQFRNSLHFICLQATPVGLRLDVIRYLDRQPLLSRQVNELATNQLASFVDDEGTLRILLAVPSRINGTSMYSVDRLGNFIEETHTINTQLVSAMTIWRMELNWEWQLAIANQPTYERLVSTDIRAQASARVPLPDPRPMISILSWRSTYFDSYQLVHLPHDGRVNKLEPMHINGQEFLIVAMEPQRSDPVAAHPPVDSLIYKLDFSDGSLHWLQYQYLQTRTALDAKSFTIAHAASLQRDYYIALLGQSGQPTDQRALSDQHGLHIYKYFGDQFVRIQSVPIPGATKLDTITYGVGDSYVILAVLSEFSHQVSLYLFDGMNLKSMASPFGAVASQPNSQGPRRTMSEQANVHLFLIPHQVQANESEGVAFKRTLDGGQQSSPAVPAALALSLSEPNLDSSLANNLTLYHIPVDDAISSEQSAPASKRNFVGEDLLGWCKSNLAALLADAFDSTSKQLLTLPKINQNRPIELNGDLLIHGDLHVSNLLYATKIVERREPMFYLEEQIPRNFSQALNLINQVSAEVESVKRKVDRILVDDGSNQDVFNPLTFENLQLECQDHTSSDLRLRQLPFAGSICPHVNEIRTNWVNARDVSDIQQQALLTGRSMTIARNVRFEHLVLRGSTHILNTLNEILISDIVFKRGPSAGAITGHKTFVNGLYASSELKVGLWNGNPVDRLTYLTSNELQRIDTRLYISRLIVDSGLGYSAQNITSRIGSLNGVNLDMHLDKVALSTEDNNFLLPLHFDELILNGPVTFSEGSHLSYVDVENLWLNTMFKHLNQNVTAPMEFADLLHISFGGNVIVDGLVNGIPLRHDTLMMRDRDYSLVNPVLFEGQFTAREVHADRAINGIQVVVNPETRRYELAILYDSGTQVLTGDKILNELHLGGRSFITGTINGHLNLTQLHSLASSNLNEPRRFSTVRLSGQNIRLADGAHLHVDSAINGFSIEELCSLANQIVQAQTTKYDRLRFHQPVHFRSLRCAAINGFASLPRHFLTRRGSQHVAGTLRFAKGAIFNTSLNIMSQINGLGVAHLSRDIARTLNESRTGHKSVHGDLVLDDLVASRMNNLQLSSIFLARSDHPQFVRAPMTFDHLDIENVLVVGNNLRTRFFNKLNVTDIISNTLQYDSPQVIYNHVELHTLHLLPQSNLITSSFNGVDLRRLYADAVLADVPQQILAPKTFRGRVEFLNRVLLRHGFDELADDELRFNLLLHSDEMIDGDLEFNTDVVVKKELEIQSGYINDVDVRHFVDALLYENRPQKNGMRVLGNGSVLFRDVQVNDLVVAGTVQGVDLSKEAITRNDFVNNTYDSRQREQQAQLNNRRLMSSIYGPGKSFQVASKYRGDQHAGSCYVQDCLRATPPVTPSPTAQRPTTHSMAPLPPSYLRAAQPPSPPLVQYMRNVTTLTSRPPPPALPPPPPVIYASPRSHVAPSAPKYSIVSQVYPDLTPKQFNLVNSSQMVTQWRPNWTPIIAVPRPTAVNVSGPPLPQVHQHSLVFDPQFLEYKSYLQSMAIGELARRINKYLSLSFFYEIAQKHPLLGPLLHAARSPIEEASALLLLKGLGKPGEPCLQSGQTIAVMAQQRQKAPVTFTQSSLIQDTSNPAIVRSIDVGQNYYLFVLDSNPGRGSTAVSQVVVYKWNHPYGMYDQMHILPLSGFPSAMRVFSVGGLACIALAAHNQALGNHTGSVVLHCQSTAASPFDKITTLPIGNSFDLDIVNVPGSSQIIIAALSRQHAEQIGDLSVHLFDTSTGRLQVVAQRRLVMPLKLHFLRNNLALSSSYQLVVSETITSSDDAQALTRIFSLRIAAVPGKPIDLNAITFYQSQLLRDNQFYDIQSVVLNGLHSMLFMQSTHSISIYAPLLSAAGESLECDMQYSLVQRLPTRGANRFLVFNEHMNATHEVSQTKLGLLGHFLVLSRDDCEQRQYATLILRAKFK